jgi:hypothetical protein
MTGRSRSHRRLTVGWLTSNTAPATSCVTFFRIKNTTIATDRNNPNAIGRPRETKLSAHTTCTRTTGSVSCSSVSPVIASYRNSSCPIHFDVCPTTKQDGKGCCTSTTTRTLAPIDRQLHQIMRSVSIMGL